MIIIFKSLKGDHRDGDGRRGTGLELQEGKLRLETRRTVLARRVVEHWSGLPGEVVGSPSPGVFKSRSAGPLAELG